MDVRHFILAAVCILAPSCKGDPMVSGKPVSFWVAKLDDRDRREWYKAFDALERCTKEDLRGAKKRLREMAVGSNIFSRRAALILFNKFQEVDPKFADAYLVTDGRETFVRGRDAFKALILFSNEGELAAWKAMERKLNRTDETDTWGADMVKLSNEAAALSKAKK